MDGCVSLGDDCVAVDVIVVSCCGGDGVRC